MTHTYTDSQRLAFLHSTNKDAEGYEYGVARVRFDAEGRRSSCLWTFSDHSDLDALMKASGIVPAAHPDDIAVDSFATLMKLKMAVSRANGRSGWDDPAQCTVEYLSDLLRESVGRGDPVDVANFAMMLDQRGSEIVRPSLAKYIDAINAAPNAQAVVVDGQPVFINRGTSEQDWIDMAEHQELEAMITDVKYLAGEISLRMPDGAEVPQWVESGVKATLLLETRPAKAVQS